MFITLEDETGFVNLIVWERVWSRARRIASGSRLLEVHGMLQKEGLVTHVVAQKLVDRTRMLGTHRDAVARLPLNQPPAFFGRIFPPPARDLWHVLFERTRRIEVEHAGAHLAAILEIVR